MNISSSYNLSSRSYLLTEMRGEGKDQAWLDKNVWFVRKKKRIYKQDPDEMIEWEPSSYTFDWNGRQITVADYYREYYGVRLKYPEVGKACSETRIDSSVVL